MARPRRTSREALGVMAIGKFFEGLMGGMKARQEREIEEFKEQAARRRDTIRRLPDDDLDGRVRDGTETKP